uniref:HYLS1_C domain-containing protein n=1 Tax=Steinernema glaseri TaxID=37863 RepID=A0A1I7YGK4_9BILA
MPGRSNSEEELNDEDIQKVIEEMGYQVPEGFNLTLKDLDRFLGDQTVNDFNTSLFSGLQCDDLLRTSMFGNPPSAARHDPDHISLTNMTSISEKEERALKKLLHQGYECLKKLTEEMEYIDEKLNLKKDAQPESASNGEPIVIAEEPTPFQEINGNPDEVRSKRPQMGQALRPVPAPMRAPGRAAFKHDPVTRYQQYAKEWLENPPPGEKKRLALRWKVREYMMRMDAPIFKPLSDKPPVKKPWTN